MQFRNQIISDREYYHILIEDPGIKNWHLCFISMMFLKIIISGLIIKGKK